MAAWGVRREIVSTRFTPLLESRLVRMWEPCSCRTDSVFSRGGGFVYAGISRAGLGIWLKLTTIPVEPIIATLAMLFTTELLFGRVRGCKTELEARELRRLVVMIAGAKPK